MFRSKAFSAGLPACWPLERRGEFPNMRMVLITGKEMLTALKKELFFSRRLSIIDL
jgi:hypothetical protein